MQRFFRRIYLRDAPGGCKLAITLPFLLWLVWFINIPTKVDAQPKPACSEQSEIVRRAIADIDETSQDIIERCGLSTLRNLLATGNTNARYFAVYALGRTSSDASDVVSTLKQVLNDQKNSDLYAVAAQALGQIGPAAQAAVPELIELLKKHSENSQASAIGNNAAYALGQIGPAAREAIPTLTELLKRHSENSQASTLRANAAYALGQILQKPRNELLPPNTVFALAEALKDENENVQANAAYALGQIKPVEQDVVLPLIEMLKSKSDSLSSAASYALGEIQPDTPQVLQALTEASSNKDTNVRLNVARLLGQIGLAKRDTRPTIMPTIIQPLIHALENDSSNSVRIIAVQALVQINSGEPSLIRAYVNALQQKDTNIKAEAVFGLGEIYKGQRIAFANNQTATAELKDVTDKLSSFLCNKGNEKVSEDVRIVSADALGKVYAGTRQRVDVLLCAFNDTSESTTVRALAAAALGQIGWGDSEVVLALSTVLSNNKEDILVRIISYTALQGLGDQSNELAKEKLQQLQKEIETINTQKPLIQLLGTERPGWRWLYKCLQKMIDTKKFCN